MKEALFYKKLEDRKVQCILCPHNCIISEGKLGFCRVRKNISGKLVALTYNKPVSISIDPIEKKPLYHFHPHEMILSFGTFGCNLACKHCQNFGIAKEFEEKQIEALSTVTPEEIIKICLREGLHMIAYTYNEPTIFYEFMLETAKMAKQHKIENVVVSNGFINKEPLRKLLPFIDAANIDLKSFDEHFYKKISSATLKPVLDSLKVYKEACHLEITNLIIPTLNDDLKTIENMCKWIKENLGEDTPLHLSRFFPHYKMNNIPATQIKILLEAEKVARRYLKNVHLGNV